MKFQPLKFLFFASALALEVSLLHFGVSLLTIGLLGVPSLNWLALLFVATIALLTVDRFEAPDSGQFRRLAWQTLVLCVVTLAYGIKVQAGGGWGLLSGWESLWPFQNDRPDGSVLGPTGLLLVCLWAWWRGSAVADHDHGAIVTVVQRGVLVLVVMTLLLTPLTNLGAPPWGALLAAQAVVTIGIGLVCLSLARIVASNNGSPGAAGWHWFRSSFIVSIALVVAGVLLLGLFSPAATALVRAVLYGLTTVVALLVAPLANLIFRILSSLTNGAASSLPQQQPTPTGPAQPAPVADNLVGLQIQELIVTLLTAIAYLLPLVILLFLVLFVRRRRRTVVVDDALHESLWDWRGVGADLLSLLGSVRLPQRSQGLRDVLGRLRGDDPVRRIRRRYVELLLAGEAADRQRPAQATPLEFEQTLVPLAPPAAPAVHTLTDTYDRARYAPDTVESNDAASADEAWTAINQYLTEEKH